ncbi:hypothetical protein [Aliiruegeria sabulilitoris]|uniref:hypothetical protein n=1 Tax=Aliiruegeria sabulilitoris TaxID=1510458 RepID=UPI00082B7543|nr:hypothetical protein [Aliiruegeria sabulilitoris]NDR58045.1 hypothetical protein [Pseudoruegeria sp. M32A2M]
MKLLIDNNILSMTSVASHASVSLPGFSNPMVVLEVDDPNHDNKKMGEIECLATIARLAREKKISLCSSVYLTIEAWAAPNSFPYGPGTSLFEGIAIEGIESPVNVEPFVSGDAFALDKNLRALVRYLVAEFDTEMLERDNCLIRKQTDYQKKNLREVDRLCEICSSLSEKHYADAFHFWTCVAADVPVFLSNDRKFRNALFQNKNAGRSGTKIFSPSELLDELRVEKDPFPLKRGSKFDLFGRPLK